MCIDGLDYTGFSDLMVIFPSGSANGDSQCIDINITDDSAFERNNETFSIHVVATEDRVVVPNSYTVVFIFDDEGKA